MTEELLADRSAVVTGGGGGIGRAIAEVFAEQGARVVVADVDADRAHETAEDDPDRGWRCARGACRRDDRQLTSNGWRLRRAQPTCS